MGSKHKALADLFHHQLKDLYDAERHAAKVFAKLAKGADAAPVRDALTLRHDAVTVRAERLEGVFGIIDKKVHGLPCEAMAGLVTEAKEMLDGFEGGPAIDAGVLATAQAIEHYAIARTNVLRQWAGQLSLDDAKAPLDANLAQSSRFLDTWVTLSTGQPGASADGFLSVKQAALVGLR